MDEHLKGRLAMIAAGTIWGLSPIFYKLIAQVPPVEVFCHRVVSSFAVFFVVLLIQGRARQLSRSLFLSWKKFGIVTVASVMIASNWLLFIVAVQIERATEASFGYFIFPLIAVFLGAVVLRERLSAAQWIAVVVAAVTVLLQGTMLGSFPWIAIALASTFSVYGLIKKRAREGAIVSVAAESLLLTPCALIWLIGVHNFSWHDFTGRAGGYFGHDAGVTAMFVLSGLITAGPLVLMSYATKRLRYSEGGILLYTNPTLQFLVAVLIFMEPFSPTDLIAFMLIWSALLVFTFEAWISSIRLGGLRRAIQRYLRS